MLFIVQEPSDALGIERGKEQYRNMTESMRELVGI